jgi:hypothetical protein
VLNAKLTTLLSKKLLLRNPKNEIWVSNLAEPSTEDYGPKRAVLPMTLMMMMTL